MFKKGWFKRMYWLIPFVVIVVTYFCFPLDDWRGYFKNHWGVPVVETPIETS